MKKNNMTRIRRADTCFVITMFILCLMFFLRDNFDISISLPFFIVVSLLGIIWFEKVHLISFVVCLSLFNHGVQTNYLMLAVLLIYLIKYNNGLRITKELLCMVLVIFVELIHFSFQPFDFAEYLRYSISFITFGFLLGDDKCFSKETTSFVLKSFIFVYCFTMIDILFQLIRLHGSIATIVVSGIRFGNLSSQNGEQIVSLFDNENMIAFFSLLSFSSSILLCFTDFKKKPLWILTSIFALFFGLFSTSKAFMISVIIVAFLTICYFISTRNITFLKKFMTVFAICTLVFILSNTVFADLINNVILRFDAGDLSSGRNELFSLYNEYMIKNPQHWFFGIGLQGLREKTGISNTPHNGIQETFVCLGVVGVVIFGIVLTGIVADSYRKNKKINLMNSIPLIAFLIFTQSIQFVRLTSIFTLLLLTKAALNVPAIQKYNTGRLGDKYNDNYKLVRENP